MSQDISELFSESLSKFYEGQGELLLINLLIDAYNKQ